MIRQYYAQRFRRSSGPRERQIGTIDIGTILYIQDGIRPLSGFANQIICREPWIVEAWIPRDCSTWDLKTRTFRDVRIAGGHLAQVRSLRDRRRVQLVADWILLACVDAGLEKVS